MSLVALFGPTPTGPHLSCAGDPRAACSTPGGVQSIGAESPPSPYWPWAHSSSLFRSLWMASIKCTTQLCVICKLARGALNLFACVTMKTLNSADPHTDPWGTLLVADFHKDIALLNLCSASYPKFPEYVNGCMPQFVYCLCCAQGKWQSNILKFLHSKALSRRNNRVFFCYSFFLRSYFKTKFKNREGDRKRRTNMVIIALDTE